jgi:hypothetical protein
MLYRKHSVAAARTFVLAFSLAVATGGCHRRTAALATAEPGESYRIEWVSVSPPAALKTGEETEIAVAFRNAGTEVISDKSLAVSYHWMDAADPKRVIVWDGLRAAVAHSIRPGETYSTQLRLRGPVRPGRYLLEVDVVREGVSWFSGKGAPTSIHPITIQ